MVPLHSKSLLVYYVEMFEKAPTAAEQAAPKTHELRVAVFDLSQKALASANFAAPSLISDFQTLNDNGLPGISSEARAIRIGARNHLGLPPVDVIGRIHPGDTDVTAYAVATRAPINFRHFTVRRFELQEAIELAHEEVNLGRETSMDHIDAKLLLAAVSMREIRGLIPARFHEK